MNILILHPSYDIEASSVNAINSNPFAGRWQAAPGLSFLRGWGILARRAFRLTLALSLILSVCSYPSRSFAETKTRESAEPPEQELERLARELHDKGTAGNYDKLKAFAQKRSSGILGKRAALALGYSDYSKGHYPQARHWLRMAEDDFVLREYALYWGAMTERALNNNAGALAQLVALHNNFPGSVMNELIFQALGETALAAQKPEQALAALDAESMVNSKAALLFLRGELREQAGKLEPAARDYLAVYYQLPLT
ncbi:MAG: tetratricopeptide repeat protein, partial [Candidatus Acidiferrales bacterium]